MRIQHLINETQSQEQLDELDMSGLASKTGSVVGKTAQGIGAVAGGVKGAWDAAKAGFQSGKNFVGGQRIGQTPTSAQQVNQQGPQGTAPATNVQGQAGTAVQQMAKATAGQKPAQVGNTLYSQLKGQVGNLDKASIDKMMTLLQKAKAQAGKAQPAQGGAAGGAGVFGQMAQQMAQAAGQSAPAQPNTMANAPVSKTNTAKPDNPNAQAAPAAEPTAPAAATAPAATPPAGQQAPVAPSAADKKAMKNQYKADVAAATAAKAKPGFQQDAMDKLAQKKVNVGDGPKINAYGKQYENFEFESKFLGRMI